MSICVSFCKCLFWLVPKKAGQTTRYAASFARFLSIQPKLFKTLLIGGDLVMRAKIYR